MYGTIAHLRLKPGMEERLKDHLTSYEQLRIPGYVNTVVFRTDADPRDLRMAVVFESRDAYIANANSPEQDVRYRQMLELLEGPPAWHDGEVITRVS